MTLVKKEKNDSLLYDYKCVKCSTIDGLFYDLATKDCREICGDGLKPTQ